MTTLEEVENGVTPQETEHSMPMYPEVEGEMSSKSMCRRRPAFIMAAGIVLLLVAFIGLAVGALKKGKDTSSIDTSQSQNFGGVNSAGNEGFVPAPSPSNEANEGSEAEQTEPEPAPAKDPETDVAFPEDGTETNTTAQSGLAETVKSERHQKVIEFLAIEGVASKNDLETEGTYAFKAADWIANQDELMLEIPVSSQRKADEASLTPQEVFTMRYVMACIYFSLGGPRWKYQSNFLSGKPICEWMEMVATEVGTLPVGVGCTPEDGRVRSLFLNGNKLQNNLPSELGLLTDLIMLDLDLNFVSGTLPDSFQSMTALEHLHIGSAGITGTLPSWIGSFSNLGSLNLGYNVMHGTLPSELKNLSVLRELALDNNAFEGDVTDLFSTGSFPSLEELFLDSNGFVGQLGPDFASNMKELKQLDLSDNAFSGQVPEHFFEFPNLEVLDIHDNGFLALPSSIANNSILKFFAAQKNSLRGKIDDIINLSALTHLDLSQNELTGAIPATIGDEMVELTYLFLAENDFDAGKIPFSISNLYALKELSLKSTARTGVIPPIFGMLSQLVFLDLDNNSLDGDIPNTLGSLSNLQVLLLNRNNLSNEVPAEFQKLKKLQTLFLEGNELTGGLDSFCNVLPEGSETQIIAQCSVCNQVPDCCTQCCEDGVACNENTHVADLDPIWQLSYERIDYALDKEDSWR